MAKGDYCSKSISVRKIDNGYLREERSYNGEKSESRETFHQEHPGTGPQAKSGQRKEGDALRGAITALKGR